MFYIFGSTTFLNKLSLLSGWIIHKANCFYAVDIEMTFDAAAETCER